MAYQVGISEQARPVRSFGRRFRGFAHTRDFTQDFPQDFPHADFRRREVLDSPHRLSFGWRLHKMTKVTVASGSVAAKRYGSMFHRESAQQFASDRQQKESKRLIISVL